MSELNRLISDTPSAVIFFLSLYGVIIAFGHTMTLLFFEKRLLKLDIFYSSSFKDFEKL
jgi:hypothetical protein